jgi:hypothetical protein
METPKHIPTAAELEAAELQRKRELKEYRKNRQKAWYLN